MIIKILDLPELFTITIYWWFSNRHISISIIICHACYIAIWFQKIIQVELYPWYIWYDYYYRWFRATSNHMLLFRLRLVHRGFNQREDIIKTIFANILKRFFPGELMGDKPALPPATARRRTGDKIFHWTLVAQFNTLPLENNNDKIIPFSDTCSLQ